MSKLDDVLNEAVKPKLKRDIKALMLEIISEVDFEVKPHIQNAAIFNMMVDEKTAELRKKVNDL